MYQSQFDITYASSFKYEVQDPSNEPQNKIGSCND